MFDYITAQYHLHPMVDHFTIALLFAGVGAELAAALLFKQEGAGLKAIQTLRSCSLLLMAAGALSAVLSYLTGDSEAGRLWDSIPQPARRILSADDAAAQYLSHAALGRYLMYAFLLLGLWRGLIELSPRLARWRVAFLAAAAIALAGLGYQGKTGGELVYEYGVGMKTSAPIHGQAGGAPAVDSYGRKPHNRLAPG